MPISINSLKIRWHWWLPLKKADARIDLFTFMLSLADRTQRLPFPMKWDNFAALPVSSFETWWNKQLKSEGRNRARQAEKRGVVMREVPFNDTLARGIWEIYNECPVRQGKPFRHFGKDLATVYRETATYLDSSIFLGAYFEDSLIGFIKLVHDERKTQAGMMNIISMIKHRDKAPTNALIGQAVRACAQRGIPYLVYQNFVYGNKQSDGLSVFKERNGFQKIDVPRYYVPITALGSLALRLGLHRSLAEHIPESILARSAHSGAPGTRENFNRQKKPYENVRSVRDSAISEAQALAACFRNPKDSKMPGLAGIIGPSSPSSSARLSRMAACMLHEPFYAHATYCNTSLGVHAAWVDHKNSFSDCMPSWNEKGDICLLFSGENFADPEDVRLLKQRGHALDPNTASYLVHLYEEKGLRFLEELNGWYCGLIVDIEKGRLSF